MKRGAIIAAGVAAFVVCLVAMVPARQLASRLPAGVDLGGVGGTVWSGSARSLAVNGRALGALEWSCRPWRLLVLEWSCEVRLKPAGGAVSGDLSGDFGEEIVGEEIRGRLPISAFEGIATPRGWTGELELDVAEVRLVGRRPAAASGTLLLRGLKAPGPGGQVLGDFELVVGEGAVGGEALSGRLRDLGGPLHVRGAIELDAQGRYLLTGDAAPGPGASPAIFDALSFLGPPDRQGRRPFTIEGTL
ncbi:MAG TPA: type II secretion system protein N [Steroidobacteraceae bacterium]|nr:type II secretion system protein N [Steroidobacteraceae bacterium]